jgi:hypothetical protein
VHGPKALFQFRCAKSQALNLLSHVGPPGHSVAEVAPCPGVRTKSETPIHT